MLAAMERFLQLGRAGLPKVLDAALAAALLTVTVTAASANTDPFPYGIAVMSAAVAWRSRWPTAACMAVGLAGALSFPDPMADPLLLVTAVAFAAVGYSAAAHARQPWIGPFLLALAVAPRAHSARLPLPPVAIPFLIVGCAACAGVAVRARAHQAASWRAQATQAAGERDVAYVTAVREERERLARELHDVVTHRVSVMLIGAGAARMVLPDDPGRAIEQLRSVEDGGREALAELRDLLGLLATYADDSPAPNPQPGLDSVPTLIDGLRTAGLAVTYQVRGAPQALPRGLDLAAYRILQEALTNALRHSDRTDTRVRVTYSADALTLEIADAARAVVPAVNAGGGRGVIGIRERTALYGGTVTIVDDDRPYAMVVYLPLPPADAAEIS